MPKRAQRVFVMAGLAFASCGAAAHAESLTVASWGGTYTENQRRTIFAPFEAEASVEVLDVPYDGGLGQLRAQADAGNPTWDVVQLEGPDLVLACMEGLVEPLDPARLAHAEALGDTVTECGVGAAGWSIVIGYNTDVVGPAPTGWADFWDTATFPGKRAMRRSPQYALEAALLADGVPMTEVYGQLATPKGVDRAFAKLDEIKDDIQWWESGSQPAEWLSTGNVAMSTSYVGRLLTAAEEGAPVAFDWSGSVYSVDSWAIVAGTAQADLAYAFLDTATGAEPQAAFAAAQQVAPTNDAARALLPAEQAALLPRPADGTTVLALDDAFWVENLEMLSERFNTWLSM